MSFERWNTHFSTVVEQEVFGINFQLAQDPNSLNLGTTVWDASIVLAKFIEKNAKKGDFSRLRAKGRRALELGSGMGLGGLSFALLGADVTLTDLAPVLPLLERNYQHNLAPAVLRVGDAPWAAQVVGKVAVRELDWERPEQYASFQPPYDYILAADCVYSELAVPGFLSTILHMSDAKTSVVVVNEFRSQAVHDTFMAAFQQHFNLKKVPPSKMDPHYQHPLIHIYICKRRKQTPAPVAAAADASTIAAEAAHQLQQCGAQSCSQDSAASGCGESLPACCQVEEESAAAGVPAAQECRDNQQWQGRPHAPLLPFAGTCPAQQDSSGAAQQDSTCAAQQDSTGAAQQDSTGAAQQDSTGAAQQQEAGQPCAPLEGAPQRAAQLQGAAEHDPARQCARQPCSRDGQADACMPSGAMPVAAEPTHPGQASSNRNASAAHDCAGEPGNCSDRDDYVADAAPCSGSPHGAHSGEDLSRLGSYGHDEAACLPQALN